MLRLVFQPTKKHFGDSKSLEPSYCKIGERSNL